MEYCKYHPMTEARYCCPSCHANCCDECVDEGHRGDNTFCFVCEQPTQIIEGPLNVTPFWRRIDHSFRYPLNKSLLIFIAIISFLGALASQLPLPLMVGLSLLTTGVMMKYCFNCLSETARGNLSPPDISGAYEGGIVLIFRLFLMLVIAIIAVSSVYAYISTVLGSLLGFFLLIALPAIIITYAMTENIIEALNPLKLAAIIATIGLPYGLILAMLMIMMGSVELLSQLIGFENSLPVLSLQAMVSNFYSVVMFHLMGYMIYQYQYELGVEPNDKAFDKEVRPEQHRLLAKSRVLIKEGYWGSAEKALNNAMKRFHADDELNDMYFRFKLATYALNQKNYQQNQQTKTDTTDAPTVPKKSLAYKLTPQQEFAKVADQYLLHLTHTNKDHQLTTAYQLVVHQSPNYKPHQPTLRHQLAQSFCDAGNPRKAAQLLNGLHKDNPKYAHLIPAYELLQRSLNDIPGMEQQVQACGRLISKLQQKSNQVASLS